jgi:hypothetical protein
MAELLRWLGVAELPSENLTEHPEYGFREYVRAIDVPRFAGANRISVSG